MIKFIRKKLAKLILWALNNEKILTTDNCVSLGVDVHQMGRSWAVINIDGEKTHVIKFVDMNHKSAREITQFLRRFEKVENINVDADPFTQRYFKEEFGDVCYI